MNLSQNQKLVIAFVLGIMACCFLKDTYEGWNTGGNLNQAPLNRDFNNLRKNWDDKHQPNSVVGLYSKLR